MKTQKEKTKDEHIADILNAQILKGNISETQVKAEKKDMIKKYNKEV